jgi:hypothetical protein
MKMKSESKKHTIKEKECSHFLLVSRVHTTEKVMCLKESERKKIKRKIYKHDSRLVCSDGCKISSYQIIED